MSFSSSFDDYSWEPKEALKDPEQDLYENRLRYTTIGNFIQREKFATVHYINLVSALCLCLCLCPLSLLYFLPLFSAMFYVSESIPDLFLLPFYSSLILFFSSSPEKVAAATRTRRMT
jgi:hypothetical protein